jgi:hypothetical protein
MLRGSHLVITPGIVHYSSVAQLDHLGAELPDLLVLEDHRCPETAARVGSAAEFLPSMKLVKSLGLVQ